MWHVAVQEMHIAKPVLAKRNRMEDERMTGLIKDLVKDKKDTKRIFAAPE